MASIIAWERKRNQRQEETGHMSDPSLGKPVCRTVRQERRTGKPSRVGWQRESNVTVGRHLLSDSFFVSESDNLFSSKFPILEFSSFLCFKEPVRDYQKRLLMSFDHFRLSSEE